MWKELLKNPITIWLRCFVQATLLMLKLRKQHLKVGYLCRIKKCIFGMYNTIYEGVNLFDVELGDFTYIAAGSYIARTKIGKFSSVGPGVRCGTGRHPTSGFVSTHPIFFSTFGQVQITFADKSYFEEYQPIEIGNDVWIGANAIILDGVKIGDGAVIAAGAVVSKDVSPYAIAGGVPARVIKYRFDEQDINFLLSLKWWDKDYDWIKDNWKLWHDIKKFIAASEE